MAEIIDFPPREDQNGQDNEAARKILLNFFDILMGLSREDRADIVSRAYKELKTKVEEEKITTLTELCLTWGLIFLRDKVLGEG